MLGNVIGLSVTSVGYTITPAEGNLFVNLIGFKPGLEDTIRAKSPSGLPREFRDLTALSGRLIPVRVRLIGSEPFPAQLSLVGNFNDWKQPKPMDRSEDGTVRESQIDVDPAKRLEIKFLNVAEWKENSQRGWYSVNNTVWSGKAEHNNVVAYPVISRVAQGRFLEAPAVCLC